MRAGATHQAECSQNYKIQAAKAKEKDPGILGRIPLLDPTVIS
jgi:hypothetical protein